jgi:hypothetical protein
LSRVSLDIAVSFSFDRDGCRNLATHHALSGPIMIMADEKAFQATVLSFVDWLVIRFSFGLDSPVISLCETR